MAQKISKETQEQAMRVAKGTQKKGQTKEQTKLIALGIEKGIAEYKKQHSKKQREQDKQRKQAIKNKQKSAAIASQEVQVSSKSSNNKLPWGLLLLSWLLFIGYFFLK